MNPPFHLEGCLACDERHDTLPRSNLSFQVFVMCVCVCVRAPCPAVWVEERTLLEASLLCPILLSILGTVLLVAGGICTSPRDML